MHTVLRPAHVVAPAFLMAAAIGLRATDRPFQAVVVTVIAIDLLATILLVVHPSVRRLLPALAPIFVASVVALYGASDRGFLRSSQSGDPGYADRVALLAGASIVIVAALAAGIDVQRAIARFVEAVGRLLGVLGSGVTFCCLVLPAWAWTRLRRRDLRRGGGSSGTHGWHPASRVDTARSLGSSGAAGAVGGRRSILGRLTWSVGCVVLLLGANYGAGWAWDRATTDREPDPEPAFDVPNTVSTARDPRNDSPAMAAYPWREQYFRDIQRTPGGYWPFTEFRPGNFQSPYVNQTGWIRKSYEPADAGDEVPSVWMFGGSTTWGEGQRDEYTIASWLARLAEDEGIPIRIDNYGERGWTHFQEMILYEQELGLGGRPDFSIFYDGANEITAQSLLNVAVPTHVLAYTYAQRLTSGTIATRFTEAPADRDLLDDLYAAYIERSALHKLVRAVRSDPAEAAPAQESPTTVDPGAEFTGGQEQREDGAIYDYTFTPQDGIDAGKVYENGKRLTMSLSERYGVESLLFWQPVGYHTEAQDKARAQLTDSTIDISDVLRGHPEVFIDGGHTNEEGARLVAIQIWSRLRPEVERWYEERS